MSSSIVFDPGFGDSRQAPRWWHDTDDAFVTVVREDELIKVAWDLTDCLASAETLTAGVHDYTGIVITNEAVSGAQIIWTQRGYGETEVTATFSTGRKRQAIFRAIPADTNSPRDYGR